MTHDDYVIAAYAVFGSVWLGLTLDTLIRVWRAKDRAQHD